MKWDVLLVFLSAAMLIVFIGVGLTEYAFQAEALAEDLSPQIGVDEDVLRVTLERVLSEGSVRRTAICNAPLALLCLLLTVRLATEKAASKRRAS